MNITCFSQAEIQAHWPDIILRLMPISLPSVIRNASKGMTHMQEAMRR